jgi:hypothetical protein
MYRLKSLTRTCDSCPAQWDGVLKGRGRGKRGAPVYIRYRWGVLRVDLYPGTTRERTIYNSRVGGMFDGSMTDGEMLEHVKGVLVMEREKEKEKV